MGNLFSGENKKVSYDLYLDFENAKPTAAEQKVFDYVSEAIREYPDLIRKLEEFDGCAEEIKMSIANPNDQSLEDKTWKALIPRISALRDFYVFSTKLVEVIPMLFKALCSEDPVNTLGEKQSLTKLLAEIFYFILRFDELKMGNASVQNVFPYYRRLLNKRKMEEDQGEIVVKEDLANKMTLFYASTTPMLTVTTDITTKFVNNGEAPIEHVTHCLAVMAMVCKEMVENPDSEAKLKAGGSVNFVLRVMVGVVILYDHIHPVGAFSKKSPIDIRGVIRVLKDPSRASSTNELINALRYRTKHINDEDTPKALKAMLES